MQTEVIKQEPWLSAHTTPLRTQHVPTLYHHTVSTFWSY